MKKLFTISLLLVITTTNAWTKDILISMTDAFTNSACAQCQIEVQVDNKPPVMLTLDDKGSIKVSFKKKIHIDATAGKTNYIPSKSSFTSKRYPPRKHFLIYPNNNFEIHYLAENNCKTDTYKEEVIKDEIDQPAEFNGDMKSFLAREIKYPEISMELGEQGKVFTSFIVEKDGRIACPQIIKSVSPHIDAETLRVIRAMPPWSPGINNGEPIRVRCRVPLNFILQ